jgi:hypothetical protein
MTELKTQETNASVADFINTVSGEAKRTDSLALLDMFTKITGEQPKMWGTSIIGFGKYHYKSAHSKQEGDWMLTGFSPRKQNLTLYLMLGYGNYGDLLQKLGKHKMGKGCLYINKLDDVDLAVLKKLIATSFALMKKKSS